MTLADISIKRPVFAWMVMIGLMFFGLFSYFRMGVSQLPNIDFPVVSINLTWEGAAPEVMETDVVDQVEQAVMGVQGIKDISSSTRVGQATITLEFEQGRDIDFAVQEVQTKIAQAQRLLPTNMDPPVITKVNPAEQPIIWMAVTGDKPLRQLMEYVQSHLQDKFSSLSGVGEVMLGGYVDPNLRVWVDVNKLNAYELTVDDVVSAIGEGHVELPAGRVETKIQEQDVRMMGEARNPEEFGDILITKRATVPIYRPIYMKDVATIEDGLADIRRLSRFNGEQAVGLGIKKQPGTNEVEIAHRVKERLAQIQKELPPGIKMGIVVDRTKFIEDSIHELTITLLLSALITSLVCWLFLGAWSATLNILLAIPTSILGTFLVINFLHFTLNTFTVLGLSLAIGIVVDDSIMVLENIVRYRENGYARLEGAQEGARQITPAAAATTMAMIAIFIPVIFMAGIMGKFFYEFGITISVAVGLSLLEALMLTPMRCSQFLEIHARTTWLGKGVERSFKALAAGYRSSLTWALRHRMMIFIGALVVFVISLGLTKLLRNEFVPPQDQSMFMVSIKTPPGSSIDFTNERFREAEKFVASRPETLRYFEAIGGFNGGDVNTGIFFMTFKDPKDRPVDAKAKHRLSQGELMILFRKELNKVPGIQAFVQDLSLSGFSAKRGFPIEISVAGPDWGKLVDYAMKIKDGMAKTGLMVDVDTDYLVGASEIQVVPDRKKANDRGVAIASIGSAINTLIGGDRVGKYTSNGRRYDVRVRLLADQRTKKENIDQLWVWNNRGERVQLKDVVTVVEKPTAQIITRRARERAISLFANVAPGKSQADAIAAAFKVGTGILPEGYHMTLSGSAQTYQESSQSMALVFWLGIVVAYMVLASQFDSFVHPLLILLALPFSISGAVVALLIGRQSMNIYSIIGVILLMGIVKKNSILLVDFTNQLRAQGKSVDDALLDACPIRLRPIIMTSVATIVAAIPPALALGPGAEIRVPMAIAVIGGVIVSTFFTLFVVPSAYRMTGREWLKILAGLVVLGLGIFLFSHFAQLVHLKP
ncbi:MAG: efflux RND transporter permease subunit [Candidatus Omnitrophica bacterium]|nr:efflux RND transporter permease subunit [Candidatus Omnitrophota bacterium]